MSVRLLQAIETSDASRGWRWRVLIIQPGLGANDQVFPESTLQAAVPLFEKARVFCLDAQQHTKTGDKSAKQIVGWISEAAYQAGQGIVGTLNLLPTAEWLQQNLTAAVEGGNPDLFGLSIDAPARAVKRTERRGGLTRVLQEIVELFAPATVDVVWNPGTPGNFQRALNAQVVDAPTKEERMTRDELIKALQATRPDLLEGKDAAALTDEELMTLLKSAMTPAKAQQAGAGEKKEEKKEERQPAGTQAQNANGQAGGLSDEDRAVVHQAKVVSWNAQIHPLIAESKLPEKFQASLRKRFQDQPGDFDVVQQAIADYRELVASQSQSGKVQGLGFAHELQVESEPERLQASMDKLFGVESKSDAPAFVSIRQAYARVTGDLWCTGRSSSYSEAALAKVAQAVRTMQAQSVDAFGYQLPGYVRVRQAQETGSWPLLLANSMYRRLLMAYRLPQYFEDRIISSRRRAADFRTLEAMAPNPSTDLPTVAEKGDYLEAPTVGEEGVNYKVAKRGRIISVTWETIVNDDLGAVRRMLDYEGDAARRTFARFIWNLLMSNTTYDGDGLTVFHASHNNLGSAALSADATGVTNLVARLNALMNQTAPGSGEKLGGAWWMANILLAVPTALQAVAKQLNQSSGIPGAANEGDNPVYALFGRPENPERILVNPLFTDATDWYLFNPAGDMIEAAFLNGQEEPELFVSDDQRFGQMFHTDQQQFKIRHVYGAEVLNFRYMDKSVVAG